MTALMIETRIKDLQRHRDQLIQDTAATDGAIQDCQFWLAQVLSSAATPEASPIVVDSDSSSLPEN